MNTDGIVWTNMALYALASVAAFGSLNKQKWGTTRPCIIGATLLIALGTAGQALGQFFGQWAHLFDTATAGGVLVLLIASQRVHTWWLERWANPVASAIAAGVSIVFLVGLLSGCSPAPICDKPEAALARTAGGQQVYVFELEQMAVLSRAMEGLASGTCRLEAP